MIRRRTVKLLNLYFSENNEFDNGDGVGVAENFPNESVRMIVLLYTPNIFLLSSI